jgi:hypothetical protein
MRICRRRDHRRLGCWPSNAESALMERFADVQPVRLIDPRAADPLRLAVAAYLARYTGSSRDHAHLDLRCFLSWCAERDLDPLAASRVHLELYIRWMQEVRRFKPSTVSRRFSVTAGFYRTAVIDGVLDYSPAVPPRSRRRDPHDPASRPDLCSFGTPTLSSRSPRTPHSPGRNCRRAGIAWGPYPI